MTCSDCIHYNSINETEGRCDKMTYLGIVDVVDGSYKACKEYEPKEKEMTCKDCIYYNPTEHPKPEWIGYNRCDKHQADGYQEYVGKDSEICEDYEDKDGLYSDGTWHCPRCGRPVSKRGLCMDCEILYVTPKRKIVPVNLKIENISKHEFDFSDIEGIEDSWESVSK